MKNIEQKRYGSAKKMVQKLLDYDNEEKNQFTKSVWASISISLPMGYIFRGTSDIGNFTRLIR